MRQQELSVKDFKDFNDWTRETWVEYASCTVRGNRLVMQVSLRGPIMVIHGTRVLYVGDDITKAIEAWESA